MKVNITLFLATLILSAFSLELAANYFGYHKYKVTSEVIFKEDFSHAEGAVSYTTASFDWYFQFPDSLLGKDSIQIGAKKYSIEKKENLRRILFLGDSATFGMGLKDTYKSYPWVVEQKLQQDANVEVINSGVPGLSNVSEWRLFNKLLPLSPDVVVLGVFMANDLNLNLLHKQSLTPFSKWGRATSKIINASAFLKFLYLRYLSLGQSQLVSSGADPSFIQHTPSGKDGLNLMRYVDGEISTYMKKESAGMNKAYEVFKFILEDIKEKSLAHGFEFVVLLIPTRSSVIDKLSILPDDPRAEENFIARGFELDSLDFDRPNQKVMSICRSVEVNCLSVLEEVRRGLREDFFLEGDDHPSLAGHLLLAEKLQAFLKEKIND